MRLEACWKALRFAALALALLPAQALLLGALTPLLSRWRKQARTQGATSIVCAA